MAFPPFITAVHIAALLGLSDDRAFLAQRDDLVRDHGFPLPMPTSKRPLLWRLDQVTLWIDRQGLPQPAMPAPVRPGGNVFLMQRAATP
jgi:hypothetical protein